MSRTMSATSALQLLLFTCSSIYYCHGSYIGDVISKPEEFGYSEENGPATWSTRFNSCGGRRQSPIDINEAECIVDAVLPPLKWRGHWEPRGEELEIRNTWHSVEVTYSTTDNRPTLRGGPLSGEYVLSQIHFHWGSNAGSEHALNHRFYGMEMHMVHYKTAYGTIERASLKPDGLVVVALFLKSTSQYDNPELSDLVYNLKQVRQGGSNASVSEDTMWWLRKHLDASQYYTYQGSLTTPPCTEAVTWIVLKHHGFVGRNQIRKFQQLQGREEAILENRRPVQRHNGRHVVYHSADRYRYPENFHYYGHRH